MYQYIPPELSNGSTTTDSSKDDVHTPGAATNPMLHVFQSNVAQSNKETNAAQIKNQNAMPYSSAHSQIEQNRSKVASLIPEVEEVESPRSFTILPTEQFTYNYTPPVSHVTSRPKIARTTSISRSTRSIGVNTESLPPGIWPEDLFEVPQWQQAQRAAERNLQVVTNHCPMAKDMSFRQLGFDPNDLASSTNPMPSYSTFYRGQSEGGNNSMAIDHFVPDNAVDPAFLEALFDVPGCSLPGVACQCGEGCSCVGCQTHKDNQDNITFADFDRMDFSSSVLPPRPHPATCCDTRIMHEHGSVAMQPPPSCCKTSS